MIEIVMFVALGFLLASLFALLLAPPLWRRAVRLTTRRLETTMPMSRADIQADKDELRAQYAIKLRQLELSLEKSKEEAARNLVERNRAKVTVDRLNEEIKSLQRRLAARGNEASVLQQNVEGHIPRLEAQVAKAREAIAARDREIHKLKNALRSHGGAGQNGATSEASEDLDMLLAENERLKQALKESGQAGGDAELRAEIRSLADQLMGAPSGTLAALAGEKATKPRRTRRRAGAKKSMRSKSANEQQDLGSSAAEPGSSPKKSLTDRLKSLATSEVD
jgi:DNA repair exonuclease SbcCD ATPase subunit